jgi:hypothetical protein
MPSPHPGSTVLEVDVVVVTVVSEVDEVVGTVLVLADDVVVDGVGAQLQLAVQPAVQSPAAAPSQRSSLSMRPLPHAATPQAVPPARQQAVHVRAAASQACRPARRAFAASCRHARAAAPVTAVHSERSVAVATAANARAQSVACARHASRTHRRAAPVAPASTDRSRIPHAASATQRVPGAEGRCMRGA